MYVKEKWLEPYICDVHKEGGEEFVICHVFADPIVSNYCLDLCGNGRLGQKMAIFWGSHK